MGGYSALHWPPRRCKRALVGAGEVWHEVVDAGPDGGRGVPSQV